MSESTNHAGDEKYWAALATLTTIGPAAMLRLHDRFKDMSLAWNAARSELIEAGIPRERAAHVVEERKRIDPDLEMERVESANARLITFGSAAFPPLLREIPSPPAVLYTQGGFTEQDLTRTIAIVGTRRISPYGRQITRLLAADLAAAGLTVISGLAFGVDGAAHRAALDAGGRTVAVLGTGIDIVYPAKHRGLAGEIADSGAVVTEFPPGTKPAGENFPQRNRIISGLSMATLITEAPAKSGALITASFANHQGRDVLAVPGDVFSVLSAGLQRADSRRGGDGPEFGRRARDDQLRGARHSVAVRSRAAAADARGRAAGRRGAFSEADPQGRDHPNLRLAGPQGGRLVDDHGDERVSQGCRRRSLCAGADPLGSGLSGFIGSENAVRQRRLRLRG